jgi:hypothetical protein
MTEAIGRLWEEGESKAEIGELHEAVLFYQRAKTLLIAESKKIFGQGNAAVYVHAPLFSVDD